MALKEISQVKPRGEPFVAVVHPLANGAPEPDCYIAHASLAAGADQPAEAGELFAAISETRRPLTAVELATNEDGPPNVRLIVETGQNNGDPVFNPGIVGQIIRGVLEETGTDRVVVDPTDTNLPLGFLKQAGGTALATPDQAAEVVGPLVEFSLPHAA